MKRSIPGSLFAVQHDPSGREIYTAVCHDGPQDRAEKASREFTATNETVATDKDINKRQAQEILEKLREGPATSSDLAPISFRYGARIFELRKAGVEIAARRISQREWEYRLTGMECRAES